MKTSADATPVANPGIDTNQPFLAKTTPAKKKPATLLYGTEERPPGSVLWIGALQHAGLISIFMSYPLIVARTAGLGPEQTTYVLQTAFLALAVAAVLQALRRGAGAGLLAPSICTGIYLAPSLLAVQDGGMPLVWGMTIFAGVFEMVLASGWNRLRPFVPPEATGLVLLLVGLLICDAALRTVTDARPGGTPSASDCLVGACSFGVMAALNVWNAGRLRTFCVLVGVAAGYLIAAGAGLLNADELLQTTIGPTLALPGFAGLSWRFDWSLAPSFAVSSLAAAMTSDAAIVTCQRLTDAEWVRPEMKPIARGVLGNGIATVLTGLLGAYGVAVSGVNAGLVAATGVASRRIAYVLALLLVVLALLPPAIRFLTIMPKPVMSAAMLFSAVFIVMNGVQIISSRVLDSRRTLVVGLGLAAFMAGSVHPTAFAAVPAWAQPLVTSPLVLATLVALSANLLFRIGIRKLAKVQFEPAQLDLQQVSDFVERQAGIWGARRDVATRVEFALAHAVDNISPFSSGPIRVEASFDEFVIAVTLAYEGQPLGFPDRAPLPEDVAESEDGARRLAGFLIRSSADRLAADSDGRQSTIRLWFEH